jgi:hypothetical protein
VEGARASALAFFGGFHDGILADFAKCAMKKFFTIRIRRIMENAKRNKISA